MEAEKSSPRTKCSKEILPPQSTLENKNNINVTTRKSSPTKCPSNHSEVSEMTALVEEKNVILSQKAIVCLLLWYCFSVSTLFLNKYILSFAHGEPTVLGSSQLFLCSICGYVQVNYTCGIYKSAKWERNPNNFYKNMLVVGTLRFSTLFLGLVALWYVPVSFAETVKSSAPVFTVILAWLLMGEKTRWLVVSSLFPVMGGLALCSANEMSFNFAGFMAAMSTNLSECLQNVYSKKLLSGDKHSYSPPELQFYTAVASILIQIPTLILVVDHATFVVTFTWHMALLLLINGLSFHCQSITEYTLLGYVSPVTHSVANTVKRALMIWLSVLVFGNKVTFLSGLGTSIVIFGVFLYIKARQIAPSLLLPPKEEKTVHKV